MSVIALIPAYNAAGTIAEVVHRIPQGIVDEIAVVDDGSKDDTYEIICNLGGRVTPLRHERNRGYGGAQKTLYSYALTTGHDYFVNLNADGGHLPEEIPVMLEPLLNGRSDVVLGSRTVGVVRSATSVLGSKTLGAMLGLGGMPAYKFIFHKILTGIQNYCYGAWFDSWHSGFRAIHRSVLGNIPYQALTEWYEYDTEFLMCMARAKASFEEVPVSVCYRDDAGTSAPVFRYGWKILEGALRYRFGQSRKQFLIRTSGLGKTGRLDPSSIKV